MFFFQSVNNRQSGVAPQIGRVPGCWTGVYMAQHHVFFEKNIIVTPSIQKDGNWQANILIAGGVVTLTLSFLIHKRSKLLLPPFHISSNRDVDSRGRP
jgi:hypothetical protein